MANVNIKFNNKDYLLSCDDGQEENLKELASHLDSKYNELSKNLGNIGENKLLLITAIQMVDDFFDLSTFSVCLENEFFIVSGRPITISSIFLSLIIVRKISISFSSDILLTVL